MPPGARFVNGWTEQRAAIRNTLRKEKARAVFPTQALFIAVALRRFARYSNS